MKAGLLISLALVAATLLVYWQVGANGFINFDDPGYVYENPHVAAGLTPENVRWAFTAVQMGNWHPLTWLSHMTDCGLFGLDPGRHHLSSLFFHILNTFLLFKLLSRMTGTLWRSAFVAALFALHPLHVESVAWIAERKDVLSTLFWTLTMLSFLWYVERPGWRRYLPVLLFFVLGLMAKPMLVTLPLILLLLDYWPLGRFSFARGDFIKLLIEKAPLFAIAAISCLVTIYAQQKGGAVSSLETVSLQLRAANALIAWTGYIWKMVWPLDLAFLYPLGSSMPMWKPVAAAIFLLAVSTAAFMARKKYPYLLMGWIWYIVTLIPVIGLVQIGLQSMADRYTYVPLIGLFIMAAWGFTDLTCIPFSGHLSSLFNRRILDVPLLRLRFGSIRTAKSDPNPGASSMHLMGKRSGCEIALSVAAVIALAMLAAVTWRQIGYWKDSTTLFSHAIAVTPNNFLAHNNLGTALAAQGRTGDAVGQFRAALAINPNYADARYNLGNQLAELNRPDEAIYQYMEAVRLNPGHPQARNNLGIALAMKGEREKAAFHFAEAVRLNPDYADARYNLGIAFLEQGRIEEAAGQFSAVLRIQPGHGDARSRLEYALSLLKGTTVR